MKDDLRPRYCLLLAGNDAIVSNRLAYLFGLS